MKSAQLLHSTPTKRAQTTANFGRSDVRHWQSRVRKTVSSSGNECHDYAVQIAYRKRRARFPLSTQNKEVAARKAQEIYLSLVGVGWDATLAKYKPAEAEPQKVPETRLSNVGEFLEAIKATSNVRKSTFRAYAGALRTIAAGIGGIKDAGHTKHDSRNGGSTTWRAQVDTLSLEILTGESVQQWRISYISKAGNIPNAKRMAETSATALIRNARALFADEKIVLAKSKLRLPNPLPFAGIRLKGKLGSRYVSRVNAETLIVSAKRDLDCLERRQQFKIFCLGLLCGLRKAEIDTLRWSEVDLDLSRIHIQHTEIFGPKSEESAASIDLDPELTVMMREWKEKATGLFVVESRISPRYNQIERPWYRCAGHFKKLYSWLKSNGVTARKPLHEMRKELGAILSTAEGIFAAQRVLRHSHIATTAAYYADQKKPIVSGLGAKLARS